MREPDRTTSNDAVRDDSAEGGVGDVETAGETTAAATIGGPVNTGAVGADTLVKVADARGQAKEQKNEPE